MRDSASFGNLVTRQEVAEDVGCSYATVRYRESIGLLVPRERTERGGIVLFDLEEARAHFRRYPLQPGGMRGTRGRSVA